jgi:hypothetical protein
MGEGGGFLRVRAVVSLVSLGSPIVYLGTKCRNPSLGFATKAKGLQGCGLRRSLEVTSHTPRNVRKCEGVNPHTPKATPTLGDGVPMDSRNFKERFQGSKLNGLWFFFYDLKALET